MDLMRKIINSPLVRRKSQIVESSGAPAYDSMDSTTSAVVNEDRRYFGLPLEKVVERDQLDVPVLIVKACEYICQRGQHQIC